VTGTDYVAAAAEEGPDQNEGMQSSGGVFRGGDPLAATTDAGTTVEGKGGNSSESFYLQAVLRSLAQASSVR